MHSEIDKRNKIMEMYSQYSDSILNYTTIMLRDFHKAEDITQDTFIKAFKYFDNFEHKSTEKTWLFSIARNLTFDYLRKQKRTNLLKLIIPLLENNQVPLIEQVVENKEDIFELYQALNQIKNNYREVIIFRKIKGFSTKETSEILGWSESKVKSTLSRGLRVLEQQLIKEDYTFEELS